MKVSYFSDLKFNKGFHVLLKSFCYSLSLWNLGKSNIFFSFLLLVMFNFQTHGKHSLLINGCLVKWKLYGRVLENWADMGLEAVPTQKINPHIVMEMKQAQGLPVQAFCSLSLRPTNLRKFSSRREKQTTSQRNGFIWNPKSTPRGREQVDFGTNLKGASIQ